MEVEPIDSTPIFFAASHYADAVTTASTSLDYAEAHNCPSRIHQSVLIIYIIPVTVLNILLLHFIRFRTIESMQDYKMVLYMTTIIDFASAWMQFLIGIRPTLENDNQTYNFDGILAPLVADWPIFAGGRLHYLAMLETFTADFSFAFGVIPFIYRYFAVCWNHRLTILQFIALTCTTGTLALWSSLSFAYQSQRFYDENSSHVFMDPACVRSMTSYTAEQTEMQGGFNWILIRGWFYGLCGILFSYATTFLCFWRIYKTVKEQTVTSKRMRQAQWQLTLTIGMQAICPMIVTGSSLIFLWFGIKTEFHKALSFVVLFYSFMVFPVLNPLISLLFISSYRKGLIQFGRWIVGKDGAKVSWMKRQSGGHSGLHTTVVTVMSIA